MELFEACEQVRTVLNDADFRSALLQLMAKERALWAAKGTLLDDKRSLEGDSLADFLVFDATSISGTLIERAVNQLPKPSVITAVELREVAQHQLSGIKKEYEDFLFDRFVNFALLRIQGVAYGPMFSLGDWHVAGVYEGDDHGQCTYCILPNGYDLNFEWDTDNRRLLTPVNCWIWATSTELAVYQASADVEATIQSLVRLLKLSVTSRIRAEVQEYNAKHFPNSRSTSDAESDYDDFTPPFSWLMAIQPHIALVLKCHYTHTDFAVRVNHAIELAQCAEVHPNKAIAISFCVSAIEALLCEGVEEKGAQLRNRIPALLHFQGKGKEFRSINKAIIALYDIRSQAVHGSRLRATQEQLQSTTRLLSAILRGVLEWAVHASDESDLPEEQEWAAELRKATTDPKNLGKLAGVTIELSEHMNLFVKSFDTGHE